MHQSKRKLKSSIPLDLSAALTLNAWTIISEAIASAARCAVRRAHKHVKHPTEDVLVEAFEREAMSALSEVINFGE